MFGYKATMMALGASLLVGLGTPVVGQENLPAKKEPVRIGLVNSLFRDTPEVMVQIMMEPFGALMEAQTGVKGQLIIAGDAFDVAQRLKEDKLQLGVFNGFELGWVQQKYPELRPLMLAVCKKRELHAYVVVRNDSDATAFADLRQHSLAIPRRSREHCHLFLQRCCRENGCDAKSFFKQIVTQADQLGLRNPGEHRRVGDLVAVQVQNRQHRAVAHRVEKLVRMPARRQRTGLGLAVTDDAGDEQARVVERRAVRM